MYNILYICTLVWLTFSLVYGNQCVQKKENPLGCSIFKTESQNGCETYLHTHDEIKSLAFFIKPLNTGQLYISLHKRTSASTSRLIVSNLFSTTIDYANTWDKIRIRRVTVTTSTLGLFQSNINTYVLEVNDKQIAQYPSDIESGNQIRVKTVTSLWSLECDPRQYKPPPQQADAEPLPQPTQQPPQQVSPETPSDTNITNPALSVDLLPPPVGVITTEEEEDKGFLESITEHIPLWQLITIASVSLVLILVIIIVTVVLVLRHKRKKCDSNLIQLIQPTNHQSRLSRHVSENSLYESYGNNQVVGPAAGTGWGSHDTSQDHVYEEVHPQGISATNSDTNSDNQNRGSAHDSENSLYMGFS